MPDVTVQSYHTWSSRFHPPADLTFAYPWRVSTAAEIYKEVHSFDCIVLKRQSIMYTSKMFFLIYLLLCLLCFLEQSSTMFIFYYRQSVTSKSFRVLCFVNIFNKLIMLMSSCGSVWFLGRVTVMFSDVVWKWLGVAVNVVGGTNEINQHWARLVLGWVTVSELANHLSV